MGLVVSCLHPFTLCKMGAGSSKACTRTDQSVALPTVQLNGTPEQHKLQQGCTVLSPGLLHASPEAVAGGGMTASVPCHASASGPRPPDGHLPGGALMERVLQWPGMPAEARLRIYVLPCKKHAGEVHVLVQAASQHQFTWRPSAGHASSVLQHLELVQTAGDAQIQLGHLTAHLHFMPSHQQCADAVCSSAVRHLAHGSGTTTATISTSESSGNASKDQGSFIHELKEGKTDKDALMFSTDQADRRWVANKSMRPSQEHKRGRNSLEQQQTGPHSTPVSPSVALTDTTPDGAAGFEVHHTLSHAKCSMQDAAKQAFARQQWHKQNSVPERTVKRSFESQPATPGHHSLEVSSSPHVASSALPTGTWHHLVPSSNKEGQ